MTALMDDVIGWCGFCAEGTCKPWCGFTVQVDTSLKAPIKVCAQQPEAVHELRSAFRAVSTQPVIWKSSCPTVLCG